MNTENNILIAAFMGNKVIYDGITHHFYPTDPKQKELRTVNNVNIFQKDWNWLMLVVEKCLEGEAEHTDKNIQKAISEIYESLCSINIESTHKACSEFIKLHNQQK